MTAVSSTITVATAVAGLLAAALGILRYFDYRTRRDRLASLGTALDTVVAALASENEVQRSAAAIRMRRFFNRKSELGLAGTAYAGDALNVLVAVLRGLPTGNLQKLLADGLAHAPTLAGADLQRTNLQNAYLADVNLIDADFFQSDLSGASIKNADARRAKFYQSQLARTVLANADLRDAAFYETDLRGARFAGAALTGAHFTRCDNVPRVVAERLDQFGWYSASDPVPDDDPGPTSSPRCFISRPFVQSAEQVTALRLIIDTINAAGAEVVMVERSDSSPAGVLADIRQVMAGCTGAVVVGFRQLEVTHGRSRAHTNADEWVSQLALATPWNHAEAGLAVGMGLPILRVHERGVGDGVFDIRADAEPALDLAAPGGIDDVVRAIGSWIRRLGPA